MKLRTKRPISNRPQVTNLPHIELVLMALRLRLTNLFFKLMLVGGGFIHGPISRAAANRESSSIQIHTNLVIAAFSEICRRIAQQVLAVDLLADLGDGIFQRVLFVEGILTATGVAGENRQWILDHQRLQTAVNFLDQGFEI